MEVNKKNYQTQMKAILKKRKDQEREKQLLLEHLEKLDQDIKSSQEEYRGKKEQQAQMMKI